MLADRLRVEGGHDPRVWIDIAIRLRPVPDRLGGVLTEMLESGRDEYVSHVLALLRREGVDPAELSAGLETKLLQLAHNGSDAERGRVLALLGARGTASDEVLEAMVRGVSDGGLARAGALEGLVRLGRVVAPVVGDLADLARQADQDVRLEILTCLTETGTREAVPFLEEVLETGTEAEKLLVLEKLQKVIEAEECLPTLRRLAGSENGKIACMAVHAAATTDRALARSETGEIISLGLQDRRPEVRKSALKSIRWLEEIPANLRRGYESCLRDPDPGVRKVARLLVAYLRNPRYSTSASLLNAR
jgi:hypothetical protein